MKYFSFENSGLPQIQQHAEGEKHKQKASAKFAQTQRHFVLFGTNVNKRKDQGPVNIPIQDISLQLKLSGSWKTAASDYSFASEDGTPQLFQEMVPWDVSANFTTLQYDETGNSQGHKQCDVLVHSWSEEKNEISVRFLKTLFFGHVKGYDVAKKIVDMLEETGFQLPLSGLISLSSDWPNVNKTIWSVINIVLLDQGLPGLRPFIPCNMQGSWVLYCHYLCSPLTHWLLDLFGKNVVFWTFWWFWVWMSAKLVLIWAKMHLQLDN